MNRGASAFPRQGNDRLLHGSFPVVAPLGWFLLVLAAVGWILLGLSCAAHGGSDTACRWGLSCAAARWDALPPHRTRLCDSRLRHPRGMLRSSVGRPGVPFPLCTRPRSMGPRLGDGSRICSESLIIFHWSSGLAIFRFFISLLDVLFLIHGSL